MPRTKSRDTSEQLLATLVAMITEKSVMHKSRSRARAEVHSGKRRVLPDIRVDPRLPKSVYEAYQQHARQKTCVCGCGGVADSASRGRTVEHYEFFRASRKQAADPVGFDHHMQLEGLILPPRFNHEKSFREYEAERDWEEKGRKIGVAG